MLLRLEKTILQVVHLVFQLLVSGISCPCIGQLFTQNSCFGFFGNAGCSHRGHFFQFGYLCLEGCQLTGFNNLFPRFEQYGVRRKSWNRGAGASRQYQRNDEHGKHPAQQGVSAT